MSEFDLHSNIDDRVALNSTSIGTDTTTQGRIIDTSGFESIEFVVLTGPVAAGEYAIILEEGDDAGLSDAAAVTSDETLGELPVFDSNSDEVTARVGSIGKKRYQRLSVISTNTSGGEQFSAMSILGHPHTAPVPQTLS